ncbi:putative Importin subunit beta-1 [Blattamonas nauphoetae]|uniref:Importin subunit beta-1 n=1 Tax=Blattamonas nauphoetae TaxID=2049346 RepID=A0ABQ9YMB2_9EUKA|nr:putative Importin subunit beta-1 [Blattamonas nauphoetae]
MSSIHQYLDECNSHDTTVREQAELFLSSQREANFTNYCSVLCTALRCEQEEPHLRRLAAILLKNSIQLLDLSAKPLWISLSDTDRTDIRTTCFQLISHNNDHVSGGATQVLATIGSIEITRNMSNFVNDLVQAFDQSETQARQNILRCLGFICEDSTNNELDRYSNSLLICILHGLHESQHLPVRVAGGEALLVSLDFASENMLIKDQRDAIFAVIFEMCRDIQHPDLQKLGFECLLQVVCSYYEHLEQYIKDIFHLTNTALSIRNSGENENQKVVNGELAKMGMSVWYLIGQKETEIAEKESSIAMDNERDQTDQLQSESKNYLKAAAPQLVTTILEILCEIDEDLYSPEEDCLIDTSTNVLAFISSLMGDELHQVVVPFVQQLFFATEWQKKDAAIRVVTAISSGTSPEILIPYLDAFLPAALSLYQSHNHVIRYSLLSLIQSISHNSITSLAKQTEVILQILLAALNDENSTISQKACSTVEEIGSVAAELYKDDDEDDGGEGPLPREPTNFTSPFIAVLFDPLLAKAQNFESTSAQFASVAWSALLHLVEGSALDAVPLITARVSEVINNFVPVMDRFAVTIDAELQQGQVLSQFSDEQITQISCAVSFVGVSLPLISPITPQLDQEIFDFAILALNLHDAIVTEDALLLLDSIAKQEAAAFLGDNRLPLCFDFLTQTIAMTEYENIVANSLNVIGTIVRSCGTNTLPQVLNLLEPVLDQIEVGCRIVPTLPNYSCPECPFQPKENVTIPPLSQFSVNNLADFVGIVSDYSLFASSSVFGSLPRIMWMMARLACSLAFDSPHCTSDSLDNLRSHALTCISSLLQALNDLKETSQQDNNEELFKTMGTILIQQSANVTNVIQTLILFDSDPQLMAQLSSENEVGLDTTVSLLELISDVAVVYEKDAKVFLNTALIRGFVKKMLHDDEADVRNAAKGTRKSLKKAEIDRL